MKEPIENALYATNRFLTTQASDLAEDIIRYLDDAGYVIVRKNDQKSFMCAHSKESRCKEQCFTCSEDEKCDNDTLSNKCPLCKSSDLFDVSDNYTNCLKCGFSFVG